MKIDLGDGEVVLRQSCPLRLSDARGIVVRCTEGVLWMTITGEAGDIVLAAGESHRVRAAGRIVIESIGSDARLRFERSSGERFVRATSRLLTSVRRRIAGLAGAAREQLA